MPHNYIEARLLNMLCFGSVLFAAPTPSRANICQSEHAEEAFALLIDKLESKNNNNTQANKTNEGRLTD